MAYNLFGSSGTGTSSDILHIDGPTVELPNASFVRDADISRDGMDLVLNGPDGTVTIEGYFSAAEAPDLTTPEGLVLTPQLVNSFVHSAAEYAQSASMNDASPVGAVDEVSGNATITRLDGSVETITLGTPVYQGDVIETSGSGAVNVSFIDETSFAVSEEARLAIDEYVFDPSTEAGTQNFSVLKGVFVFTSGLIGRDDPDDVHISTPSGSIGIRGTIIAGDIDSGEITVIEGAIVVRTLDGEEVTLDDQFETAKLDTTDGSVTNIGQLDAQEVVQRFDSVSNVSPTLFSSIEDSVGEQQETVNADDPNTQPDGEKADEPAGENFDADGSVDQNNDSEVDGTVNDEATAPKEDGTAEPQPTDGEKTGDTEGEQPPPKTSEPTYETYEETFEAQEPAPTPTETQEPTYSTQPDGTSTQGDGSHTETNPQEHTQDPSTFGNTYNRAPAHIRTAIENGAERLEQASIAPSDIDANYFQVSSNQSFEYFFDLEFKDPDGPGPLKFGLSPASVDALNIEFGPRGSGWDFNPENGHLMIQTGTIGADTDINLEVFAVDGANARTFGNYTLEVFASTNGGTASDDTKMIGSSGAVTAEDYFLGDGNDTVTVLQGDSNNIHLGNGQNSATITASSSNIDNQIFGGMQQDEFLVQNVNNEVYGMDGDDLIEVDFSGTSAASDLQTAGQNIVLDGGHSSFGMPYRLKGGTPPAGENGQGDTLKLLGTNTNDVTLDFTQVDDSYIRGIERIDLHGAADATLTFGLQDVIQMTDQKNFLIIRAGSDDTLNFASGEFSNFTQTHDNIKLDDNANPTTTLSDDTYFDVYSNGNVTLMIEDSANVNGLPP